MPKKLMEDDDTQRCLEEVTFQRDVARENYLEVKTELDAIRMMLGIPTNQPVVDGVRQLRDRLRNARRRAKLGLTSRAR